ncbi:MAG: dethiobiotin synthase [bacterium]|nr:dethiobiotin synthase [bacterium]
MTTPIFITGTDTGIGKTVLSLVLMQYLYQQGHTPFYLKPFQTGCTDPYDIDSDAAFIYRHVPQLKEKDPAESVLSCYDNPKAPYFAARDQGQKPDAEEVRTKIKNGFNEYSHLVIEGAGGLHVPVTGSLLMIDFIKDLQARVLLAARAGLGTINHTLLSIESLRSRGMEPLGVVFINEGTSPVPEEMVRENMEAVELFSGIRVSGVLNHITDFSNPPESNFKVIEKFF